MNSRTKMKICKSLVLVLVLFLSAKHVIHSNAFQPELEEDESGRDAVNIVVIGATGDLAKKYLWQGFFNLVLGEQNKDNVFQLFAGARTPREAGESEMDLILSGNVSCAKTSLPIAMEMEACEKSKAEFKSSIKYYQLKKSEDYRVLCDDVQHKMQAVGLKEKGRLFYLSVPPFAYAGIAENINQECRPQGKAWLRVVLEKPFGRDSKSAKELSSDLKKHLKEEELYRIDHYLGKTGVQSILPFRALNKETYGGVWNADGIERVEIVLKETLDAKGRISFYDKYGVIRDVMQNHMTEILALVAMEIPSNLSSIRDFQREKLSLLGQVDHVTARHAVIGQYESYDEEWHQELKRGEYETSIVPTFAGVLLSISSPLWKDVPFFMVSGKKLDEKLSYVRITFKNTEFCSITPNPADGDHACKPKQIIFFIGSRQLPTVAVSRSLPRPEVPESWTVPELDPDTDLLGSSPGDFYLYRAGPEQDAYSTLIRDCYRGKRDKFIGTPELVASWDIWTPLLGDLEDIQPRLYPGGKGTARWLDLHTTGGELRFVHTLDQEWDVEENTDRFGANPIRGIPNQFRGNPLFTGNAEDTVAFLAKHLLANAQLAIKERGAFHIAFPGGKTPEMLFMHLFLRMKNEFPWEKTHVWFVDERCVSLTARDSNFNLIYSKLLQYLSIPYTNIHPMPIQLANGLCDPQDGGSRLYTAQIRHQVPGSRFDMVVLGVGGDGHIASLFPHTEALSSDGAVLLTNAPSNAKVSRRMTLGYRTINSARKIAIVILGEGKRSLVQKIKPDHVTDSDEYPVLGVNVSDGNLAWFIDHDALI